METRRQRRVKRIPRTNETRRGGDVRSRDEKKTRTEGRNQGKKREGK